MERTSSSSMSTRRGALLLVAVVASACQSGPSSTAEPATAPSAPDLVVVSGPTFVLADGSEAKAIVVDEERRIVSVHADVADAPAGRTERLFDGWAVAGLHDAHLHVEGIGQWGERADLRGATSTAEVVERLKAFRAQHPDAPFIDGRGWDQSLFAGGAFPTAADLAPLGDELVVLTRVDGHALWVNQAALAHAGVDSATSAPDGGEIVKDSAGKPTGLFVDNAMALVREKLPAPTAEDTKRWLQNGLIACAQAGLVAVHDMGMRLQTFEALKALATSWRLPVRVFVYLDGSDPQALQTFKANRAPLRSIEVRGLKLYADGAMGSRGAALLEDYSDKPGHRGLLVTAPDQLTAQVAAVHAAGGQVAIHAIGDRGVRTALDAIEAAQGDDISRRHRIEHAQMVHPDDFARMKALGVIASMQPTHATSDMRWVANRVGPERVEGTYAWRRMLEGGVPLAFGSDAPVESHKPAWGLYAAITRQDHAGDPPGGWRPDQRLSALEALRAFSAGAAYAVSAESRLGTLEKGQLLELTIWSQDPRADASGWIDAEPVGTALGDVLRSTSSDWEY